MNVLSVIMLIVIVAVVLCLFATRIMGGTPSVFGHYIFRVSSESMEPTLSVGDIILVKKAPAEDIKINDIITFKSEEAQTYGKEVTHRVAEEPEIKDGIYHYQTKGDAPKSSLDRVITYDQVRGKYICKFVILGKIYGFLSTPVGVVVLIGVILLLFGYELVALMMSNRKIDDADEKLFASFEEKLNKIEKGLAEEKTASENGEKDTEEQSTDQEKEQHD